MKSPFELRPMRFDGERRNALAFEVPPERDVDERLRALEQAMKGGGEAALAYGVVPDDVAERACERLECTSLGAVPELVRPVRLDALTRKLPLPEGARRALANVPLFLPVGGTAQRAVREIMVDDPRVTRLWDRFSIDVGVAIERTARWVGPRVFGRLDRGYRIFVFEDGDRYVIRALCIFRAGLIVELLHDRSVAGMRAASHLLGLALRELHRAGDDVVTAWSLAHSGSFPLFVRHGFLPHASGRQLIVRALDPAVEHLVTARHHWYLSALDSSES